MRLIVDGLLRRIPNALAPSRWESVQEWVSWVDFGKSVHKILLRSWLRRWPIESVQNIIIDEEAADNTLDWHAAVGKKNEDKHTLGCKCDGGYDS